MAEGIKKMYDQYGPTGILCGASSNIGDGYYDQNVCLLNALGGSVHAEAGTVSFGSWSVVDTHMIGGFGMSNTPHHLQLITSDLHVLFGCNWAAKMCIRDRLWDNVKHEALQGINKVENVQGEFASTQDKVQTLSLIHI